VKTSVIVGHKASWNFTNAKYLRNKSILEKRIALKEPRCMNGIVGSEVR
jgi:hypothetical protein